jgi:hypothetical protein
MLAIHRAVEEKKRVLVVGAVDSGDRRCVGWWRDGSAWGWSQGEFGDDRGERWMARWSSWRVSQWFRGFPQESTLCSELSTELSTGVYRGKASMALGLSVAEFGHQGPSEAPDWRGTCGGMLPRGITGCGGGYVY